jgi:hypothetical protein
MNKIRIVFHDIVKKNDKDDFFSVTVGDLKEILLILSSKPFNKNEIEIFFDDGYKTALSGAKTCAQYGFRVNLGISTDFIGLSSKYLNEADIKFLDKNSVTISSHGCSHAALVLPGQSQIVKGGEYKNSVAGKNNSLSENEVIYQLVESKKRLEEILGKSIDNFVYPYGLYNNDLIKIMKKSNLYQTAHGCEYADKVKDSLNRFAVHRVLYSNSVKPYEFINSLKSLIK